MFRLFHKMSQNYRPSVLNLSKRNLPKSFVHHYNQYLRYNPRSMMYESRNIQKNGLNITTSRSMITISSRLTEFMIKPRFRNNLSISHLSGHISFILLAGSYMVTDMLPLRILAILGGSSMMVYNYYHPYGKKLWLPFSWNCIFLIVNCIHTLIIVYAIKKAKNITNEEKELFNNIFSTYDEISYHKLMRSGEWVDIDKDKYLTNQGIKNQYIYLITKGKADVLIDNKKIYEIQENQFVGELGLLCGLKISDSIKSSATVKTQEKVRALRWKRGQLIDILEENSDLLSAFQYTLSTDLISKLLEKTRSRLLDENGSLFYHKQYEYQYESLLEIILKNGTITEHERNILKRFRLLHHIDEKIHEKTLHKFNWKLKEYNNGEKI